MFLRVPLLAPFHSVVIGCCACDYGKTPQIGFPVKLSLIRGSALAVIGIVAASLAVAPPAHASTHTLFVSPDGSGPACSAPQPCDLATAKERVHRLPAGPASNVTVELADGVYRIDDPLEFRQEDGRRRTRDGPLGRR